MLVTKCASIRCRPIPLHFLAALLPHPRQPLSYFSLILFWLPMVTVLHPLLRRRRVLAGIIYHTIGEQWHLSLYKLSEEVLGWVLAAAAAAAP